ncbi:polyprenyl synthetase family protein [Phytoactinopolyspora endophytica]|uniref:polyprenyl synthetase family protein n=1 Tax=Phytoactinopolyspora endophytica TaxID=1642495 RepID=UPI00197BCACA|nr:polyprenyl synthetase family protein [Phytoactinopolyspora endophytica]
MNRSRGGSTVVDPGGPAPGETAGPDSRASAERLLDDVRRLIEPELRAILDRLPESVRIIAGYHAGLWDAEGHHRTRPGKALRPALALTCARAAGDGPRTSEAVTTAAVAVELLHDFSLLHDDVMDGDHTRRHRPAAWTVFGTGRAILTGDTLLGAALHTVAVSGPRAAEVLAEALLRLCRGQATDLALQAGTEQVDLPGCLAMAEDKTGALLGCACQLGAMAAGAAPDIATSYREFGCQLGVAFQLTDDLLGIWGDPASTGKPVGADVTSRKMTLPIVAALTAENEASAELSEHYAGRCRAATGTGPADGVPADGVPADGVPADGVPADGERPADTEVARVADLIERAGGRRWAQVEAERRATLALGALERADPDPDAADELRLLVELALRRNH